jgi:hypothetical protein
VINIPSLLPSDLLNDASFIFILRLVIAIFFNCPITDISIGGFYHYPSHSPWLILPAFAGSRRLNEADMTTDNILGMEIHGDTRNLQSDSGMAIRMNLVTQHVGDPTDSTQNALDRLFSDGANMLNDFFSKCFGPCTCTMSCGIDLSYVYMQPTLSFNPRVSIPATPAWTHLVPLSWILMHRPMLEAPLEAPVAPAADCHQVPLRVLSSDALLE